MTILKQTNGKWLFKLFSVHLYIALSQHGFPMVLVGVCFGFFVCMFVWFGGVGGVETRGNLFFSFL